MKAKQIQDKNMFGNNSFYYNERFYYIFVSFLLILLLLISKNAGEEGFWGLLHYVLILLVFFLTIHGFSSGVGLGDFRRVFNTGFVIAFVLVYLGPVFLYGGEYYLINFRIPFSDYSHAKCLAIEFLAAFSISSTFQTFFPSFSKRINFIQIRGKELGKIPVYLIFISIGLMVLVNPGIIIGRILEGRKFAIENGIGNYGGGRFLITLIFNIFISLLYLLGYEACAFKKKIVFFVWIIGLTFLVLMTGTRTWLIINVFYFILLWRFFKSGTKKFGKWGPIIGFGVIIFSIVVLKIVRELRVGGLYGAKSILVNSKENFSFKNSIEKGDFDYILPTIRCIEYRKKYNKNYSENNLFLFFTSLVPRAFWKNKPYSHLFEDISYFMGFRFKEYGNYTPGVVGQYYLNWGDYGVIYGGVALALFYWFLSFLCSIFNNRKNAIFVCIILSFFCSSLSFIRYVSSVFVLPSIFFLLFGVFVFSARRKPDYI